VPYKDARRNRGLPASRAASPGVTPPTRSRILTHAFAKITDPWVKCVDRRSFPAAPVQRHSGQIRPRSIVGITSHVAPTRKPIWCKADPRRLWQTTTSILRRVCHSPNRIGLAHHLRHLRRTKISTRSSTPTSSLSRANPTDAHPVFASRIKKRLRGGAKLILVDPRARHRPPPMSSLSTICR